MHKMFSSRNKDTPVCHCSFFFAVVILEQFVKGNGKLRMLTRKLSTCRTLVSWARLFSSKVTKESKPELPDYNTSINIHEHKLKRPDKPPGTEASQKWKGLKGLQERTRVIFP